MRDIIDGFFNVVEMVLLGSHWLLSRVFAPDSGWTWAGSFILLALSFQFVMSPLSIRQIKGTLVMHSLQPEIAALRKEYEHDRERLVEEQRRLWKDAGANPLASCLPVLVKVFVLLNLVNLFFNTDRSSEPLLSGEANRSFSGSSILGAAPGRSVTDSIPAAAVLMAVSLAVVMVGAEFFTRLQMIRTKVPSDRWGPDLQPDTFLLFALPAIWASALFVVPLCGLFFFAAWNLWDLAQQSIVVHHADLPY